MKQLIGKRTEEIQVGDSIPYKGRIVNIIPAPDCYSFITDLGNTEYFPPGANVTVFSEIVEDKSDTWSRIIKLVNGIKPAREVDKV